MKRILPWVGSLAILRPWICIASRAQESSPEQQEEEEDAKPLKYMVEEKRQEMVVRYENRLRFFGTPEKVFNYFASALDGADQPAMTREDFVLSFTPFMRRQNIEEAEDKGAKGLMDVLLASTKAPGASGSLKSTRVVAKNTVPPQIETGAPKSSLDLIDSSGDGLISFPEYLFCLSLLSISAKDIELAFNMFDIDGNGNVDPQEFESVVQIMREQNSVFRSKRLDKYSVHDHEKLLDHFFGIKRDKKLQLSDFKDFVLSLQAEVLTLEFSYLADSKTKHLSGGNFIKLLVCHSGNFEEYLENLKNFEDTSQLVISLNDWLAFNSFISDIAAAEEAFKIYRSHTTVITIDDFIRLVRAVSRQTIQNETAQAIFFAFGASKDDQVLTIDAQNFFHVLRLRSKRFATESRELGFMKIGQCAMKCSSIIV